MYCGQCGKKVMENMLFCPFCGAPIVIPEQDEIPPKVPEAQPEEAQVVSDTSAETVQEEIEAEQLAEPQRPRSMKPLEPAQPQPAGSERPKSLFSEEKPVSESDVFVPLSFEVEEDKPAVEDLPQGQTVISEPRRAPRPQPVRKRAAQTYIPVKEIAPEDMFMDSDDDYDAKESFDPEEYADDFDFEEPEDGSFFQRHIRGIVGLILLAVVLAVCGIWAMLPNGQLALAKINLAWKAAPYAELGYAAYQQDSDLLAARYYERAYQRDSSNYEYAHSAMVAYYEADQIDFSTAMLKKCIEMQPDNPEPYQEMLLLYPDAQTRPWEIQELIRLGYQRTGDASLRQ